MVEPRKLYELISILARRHGLLALDPPSRLVLDCVIDRESRQLRTTATDLIAATKLSRAVVYRKLADLKKNDWLREEWVDFKLCYKVGKQSETLFEALSKNLALKTD